MDKYDEFNDFADNSKSVNDHSKMEKTFGNSDNSNNAKIEQAYGVESEETESNFGNLLQNAITLLGELDEFDIPDDDYLYQNTENINVTNGAKRNDIDDEFDLSGNIEFTLSDEDLKMVSCRPSFEQLKQTNADAIGARKTDENMIKGDMSDEKTEIIFENELVKVERIFSLGYHTNEGMWYDQNITECVKVTRGEAILTVGSKMLNLIAGDAVIIFAGEKHRVDFTTDDCEWLCTYFKI